MGLKALNNVDFADAALFKDIESIGGQSEAIKNFLVHLAICHTIIVLTGPDGTLTYNSSSPDELALVNGAKFCGFEYVGVDEEGYSVIRRNLEYFK